LIWIDQHQLKIRVFLTTCLSVIIAVETKEATKRKIKELNEKEEEEEEEEVKSSS